MGSLFAPQLRQAAAIPLCRAQGGGLQVCLIRRRETRAWGIPKGFLDPGDTAADAALREAYEEAGVSGRLLGEPVGSYTYVKRGSRYAVAVFLMEVQEEETTWPERWLRVREWFAVEEGMSLLVGHPVSQLFDSVRARIGEGAMEWNG
jgi:8-oxo-dGTP pyrophosphatase MutT (NUDIX family)